MSSVIKSRSNRLAKYQYQQIVSWTISEKDWDKILNEMILFLQVDFPGLPNDGTYYAYKSAIEVRKQFICFTLLLPSDVDQEKIQLEAKCVLKSTSGQSVVTITCDERNYLEKPTLKILSVKKFVKINPQKLFDERKSFVFEAEVKISMENLLEDSQVDDYLNPRQCMAKDIKSAFQDEKHSDFLVSVAGKEFKCHKIILSTRSEYFKVMLAGDNQETQTNKLEVISDVPAKTVKDVLQYMYTGEFPPADDLNVYLLHLADMYLLEELKKACVKELLSCLDISTCISTFVMVDRYLPQSSTVRKEIIKFMTCKAADVVEEGECDKLVDNYPDLAKELMKAVGRRVKEEHNCQYCLVNYK